MKGTFTQPQPHKGTFAGNNRLVPGLVSS